MRGTYRLVGKILLQMIAVAALAGCEMSMNAPRSAPVTSSIQSEADAQDVLRNATGKFCPSLWCGVEGYQISGIALSPGGRTLTMIHQDGSSGDTVSVASLNPTGGTILGQGVVHFTGEFAPNLVTTEVEAQRLVVALDMIKKGSASPPVRKDAMASASKSPAASPPPAAGSVKKVVENKSTGSAVASTASPTAPVALQSAATVRRTFAGKRFAIRMRANCQSDPDPTGLTNDNLYSSCPRSELANVKKWIGAALIHRYGISAVTDNNPDYVLTVTLTQSMVDEGGETTGVLSWFVPVVIEPDIVKFTATYQLADSRGETIGNRTVHKKGAGIGRAVKIEQAFAEKIAATVVGSSPGTGSPPSAQSAK